MNLNPGVRQFNVVTNFRTRKNTVTTGYKYLATNIWLISNPLRSELSANYNRGLLMIPEKNIRKLPIFQRRLIPRNTGPAFGHLAQNVLYSTCH